MPPGLQAAFVHVFGGAFAFAGAEEAAGFGLAGFVGHGGFGLEDIGEVRGGGVECRRDGLEADAAGSGGPVFAVSFWLGVGRGWRSVCWGVGGSGASGFWFEGFLESAGHWAGSDIGGEAPGRICVEACGRHIDV